MREKKQKLLGKKNWYKDKKQEELEMDGKIPQGRKDKVKKAGKVECSTVVFVPNTRGGTLTRKLRERETVMKERTGFGIRFQETGGSQLKNAFSLELGRGNHCGRECPPCASNVEKRENCRTRNILYESYCQLCNKDDKGMGGGAGWLLLYLLLT